MMDVVNPSLDVPWIERLNDKIHSNDFHEETECPAMDEDTGGSGTQSRFIELLDALPPSCASTSKSAIAEHRIIIVGAGPVGLLLALLLAHQGISSLVLEKLSSLSDIPRAIGYWGPVHQVFKEAGIYDQVISEGLSCGGYAWRSPLKDDGSGGKVLGDLIAQNVMSKPDENGTFPPGGFTVQLAQNRLAEILLEHAEQTGLVEVRWEAELKNIVTHDDGVTATYETPGGSYKCRGSYLVGCDGSRSQVRKLLNIPLAGHSWPERFIATDVLRTPNFIPEVPVHFVIDPKYWAVVTPLEKASVGTTSLWRYSMAVTDASLSDDHITSREFVESLLERQIDGPRPSDHELVRWSLYRMHQLLASSMYKGRCFLAGDAAHLNNPVGGLGLCTGLLDADALAQTLNKAVATVGLSGEEKTALFHGYCSSRRRVFSRLISPVSTENKLRLHSTSAEQAAEEDWYLRALRNEATDDIKVFHRPFVTDWRTSVSVKSWSAI